MYVAQKSSLERGTAGARISTYVTVILSALKATAGILSGSVALSADALHSLADLFTSLAVWVGLKLSDKARCIATVSYMMSAVRLGIWGLFRYLWL